MLNEQQQQAREGAIGSSDAPVVCGVSPYKSPLLLFHQLRGDLERYTEEETQHQKIGSRLEPVIAELAAEELNLKIRRSPMRTHPRYPWCVANLDYEIVSNPKGPGVFEIKNRAGQKPWEELPPDIELQTRHQMAVTNRDWGVVAAMFQFGTVKHYEIERDRELEGYLLEVEHRFIVRVRENNPPSVDWNEDTLNVIRRLYPRDSGKSITLDDQACVYIAEFLQAKAELAAAADRKTAAEGYLKDQLRDATYATAPGYTLSWKSTKPMKAFDLERFKSEQPELFAKYEMTKPGYRRFLVKTGKEVLSHHE